MAQSLVCSMAALCAVFHAQRRHFCHQWKRFYYGDTRALITFISTPRQIRTQTDLEWRLSSLCFRYSKIDDKIVYLISGDMRLIEHDFLHISMHLTLFDGSFSSSPSHRVFTNSNHDLHFMIDLGLRKIGKGEFANDDLLPTPVTRISTR
jgi:hypothetical protein